MGYGRFVWAAVRVAAPFASSAKSITPILHYVNSFYTGKIKFYFISRFTADSKSRGCTFSSGGFALARGILGLEVARRSFDSRLFVRAETSPLFLRRWIAEHCRIGWLSAAFRAEKTAFREKSAVSSRFWYTMIALWGKAVAVRGQAETAGSVTRTIAMRSCFPFCK